MRCLLPAVAVALTIRACSAQLDASFSRVPALPEIDRIPEARAPSPSQHLNEQLSILSTYSEVDQADALSVYVRQTITPDCVSGPASRICLYHEPLAGATPVEEARYAQAQAVFNKATRIWADEFPSTVEIRVLSQWQPLPTGTLGSAGPTVFWKGNTCGTESVNDALCTPAVLNSLLGVDYNNGSTLDYHIRMYSIIFACSCSCAMKLCILLLPAIHEGLIHSNLW